VLVFFFQAEDGIRDLTVTGVQTCALPICLPVKAIPRICAVSRKKTFAEPRISPSPRVRATCSGTASSSTGKPPQVSSRSAASTKIGRASCRERGENPEFEAALKHKDNAYT